MYNSEFLNIQDAEIIPSVEFDKGSTPADVLLIMQSLKDKTFASTLLSDNKRTTNGAIIGLVGGFLTALWFKQNKLLFCVFGMFGGATMGYTINTIINHNKSKLTTKNNGDGISNIKNQESTL